MDNMEDVVRSWCRTSPSEFDLDTLQVEKKKIKVGLRKPLSREKKTLIEAATKNAGARCRITTFVVEVYLR